MTRSRRRWALTFFTMAVFATVLVSAAPATAGTKPVTDPKVVDADGKTIGSVDVPFANPAGYQVAVVLEVDGQLIAALVAPGGFIGSASLFFEAPDCSGGTPLMYPHYTIDRLMPPTAIEAPDSTVYIPDPSATVTFVDVASYLYGGVVTTRGSREPVVPSLAIGSLGAFTPPFRVKR